MAEDLTNPTDLIDLTAVVTAAYVAHNSVPVADLPRLLADVYGALTGLGKATPAPVAQAELVPAVPIKKSITDDFIICLENGQKFKSLKRHLMTSYNMTPADYRAKWGLPKDYPMTAPGYAKARSDLAKSLGLGRLPTSVAGKVTSVEPAARSARRAPQAAAA